MNFDETYFKSLNYANYLEREIRYHKMADELFKYLPNIGVLLNGNLIDYGCAVGFLVKGFRKLGCSCEGYDISDWAKSEAKKYGINFVDFKHSFFDVMFAFDVFEHMTDDEIKSALLTFNPKWLLVRIPCSVDGKDFYLEISKKDPTHINCKTKLKWFDLFSTIGYNRFQKIDLYTIYDSDGVLCYVLKNKL